MRFLISILPVLLAGVLVTGCSPAAPTSSRASAGAGSSTAVVTGDPSCTLALHAILREAGSLRVFGELQLRVTPRAGGGDAVASYQGHIGPVEDLDFTSLSVSVVPRLPGQGPAWTDVDKTDPGTTLTSILQFGNVAPMSPLLATALVDDPASFKAVVNAVGTTGGREAEGTMAPSTDVPESLRERQRLCFSAS